MEKEPLNREHRQRRGQTTNGFDHLRASQMKRRDPSARKNVDEPSNEQSQSHHMTGLVHSSTDVVHVSEVDLPESVLIPLSPLLVDEAHVQSDSKRRSRLSVSSSVSIPKLLRSSVSSIGTALREVKRSATLPVNGLGKRGKQVLKRSTISVATQTSPRMLEVYQRHMRQTAIASKRQAEMDVHPGRRIPTPDTSTPTLLRRLMGRSSVSPRGGTEENDYFQSNFQTRNSSASSSRTVESIVQLPVVQGDASTRTSQEERVSAPQAGGVESKYRAAGSTRKFASDPSPKNGILPTEDKPSSMPVSQLQRLQDRGYRRMARSGPVETLFRKRSSPLQQEIKRAPTGPMKGIPRAVTGEYWPRDHFVPDSGIAHLQLYKPSKLPGIDTDVPDHLAGSPLCPLNPQNKSFGQEGCPQHGHLRDEDLKDLKDRLSEETLSPSSEVSISSSLDTPEMDRPFTLIAPEHLPDSPLCPANLQYHPDGKGVCVLHGRPQVQGNVATNKVGAATKGVGP